MFRCLLQTNRPRDDAALARSWHDPFMGVLDAFFPSSLGLGGLTGPMRVPQMKLVRIVFSCVRAR
jgi:hypothetical protein